MPKQGEKRGKYMRYKTDARFKKPKRTDFRHPKLNTQLNADLTEQTNAFCDQYNQPDTNFAQQLQEDDDGDSNDTERSDTSMPIVDDADFSSNVDVDEIESEDDEYDFGAGQWLNNPNSQIGAAATEMTIMQNACGDEHAQLTKSDCSAIALVSYFATGQTQKSLKVNLEMFDTVFLPHLHPNFKVPGSLKTLSNCVSRTDENFYGHADYQKLFCHSCDKLIGDNELENKEKCNCPRCKISKPLTFFDLDLKSQLKKIVNKLALNDKLNREPRAPHGLLSDINDGEVYSYLRAKPQYRDAMEKGELFTLTLKSYGISKCIVFLFCLKLSNRFSKLFFQINHSCSTIRIIDMKIHTIDPLFEDFSNRCDSFSKTSAA